VGASDPWLELLDDGRAREASAARSRERWLRAAAAEDATLAGTLLDLAEAGTEVTVTTETGRSHRGRVALVGDDVVVLRPASGPVVVLALAAVAALRPAERRSGGGRVVPNGPNLLDVLASLTIGEAVLLTTRGGGTVRGLVDAIGADVVHVRGDDETERSCYVSARSICEVLVLRSG